MNTKIKNILCSATFAGLIAISPVMASDIEPMNANSVPANNNNAPAAPLNSGTLLSSLITDAENFKNTFTTAVAGDAAAQQKVVNAVVRGLNNTGAINAVEADINTFLTHVNKFLGDKPVPANPKTAKALKGCQALCGKLEADVLEAEEHLNKVIPVIQKYANDIQTVIATEPNLINTAASILNGHDNAAANLQNLVQTVNMIQTGIAAVKANAAPAAAPAPAVVVAVAPDSTLTPISRSARNKNKVQKKK